MDKYIRVEDAINAIKELPDSPNGFSDTYDKAQIIAELEEVHAADVRPVVRCGECVHSALDYIGERYCKGVAYTCSHVPDNWFCADGKRKDGDEE